MSNLGKEKYFQRKEGTQSISASLDEIETILAKIDGQPSPLAERLFSLMDEVWQQRKLLVDKVEKVKVETQLAYVTKRIYASAKTLIKTIGGISVLQDKRKQRAVPEEYWWWYLDRYLNDVRRKNLKRNGIIAIFLVVVAAILVFVYDQFIAPPPEVRARLAYEDRIDEFIDAGDYQSAKSELEQALILAPDYYPLWIKQGVLAQVMGNEALKSTSFATAEQLAENMEFFYYERANVYMQFRLYDDVLMDADNLLEINPQSAEAYLFRGLVYEFRGQKTEALDAFEKAALLAEDQNKTQLAATIRVRMGMLMQSISIPTQEN